MRRLARPLLASVGVIVFLLGGSLLLGGGKHKPGQVKLQKMLIGANADAFIARWAETHPSYRRQREASEAWWGQKFLPGASKVVLVRVEQEPSRFRKTLHWVFPRVQADSYSDGNGTIITSAVSSSDTEWQGNFYAYYNMWQDDINADASIDASNDYIGDANWVGGDRGGYYEHHQASCAKPSWLARATQTIWPKAEAACACSSLCQGWLTRCALGNALGRARSQCGIASAVCRRAGPAYLECLALACDAAIYVDFFDELYQYGSSCGWLDPCRV